MQKNISIVNKHWPGATGEWVARPSPLGNKWTHLKGKTAAEFIVANRDEACDRYEAWLEEELKKPGPVREQFDGLVEKYRRDGRLSLMCFCAPARCHAETIAKFIEREIDS